jgi:hypothetical protein
MTNLDFLAARAVQSYDGRPLPEPAWPVGYAALIIRYDLQVVVPTQLTAISTRYRRSETEHWRLLSNKSVTDDSLGSHLTTALKWEGVDLGILAALFSTVEPAEFVSLVTEKPKSSYGRRLWFLYEWLTGDALPIPDLGKARAVDAIDSSKQFALAKGELSARHRVRNNLPGTPAFCPLVSRSEELEAYSLDVLQESIAAVRERTPPDVIRRAGAFLELQDSKDSFQIEGEAPPANRLRRWGQAIGQAGRTELTLEELVLLQDVLSGDDRFVQPGLRREGGFVGERDRWTRAPIPDHLDARPDDLEDLTRGVIEYIDRSLSGGVNPIVVAAAAAFGLVYIHPFQDGNGRLHRWFIHHVLACGGVTPTGLVFPVSSVIHRRLAEYRDVLESYSKPLLPLIEWEETEDHNIRVTNETAAFYRYFDATRHAEFLYSCVEEAVNKDLPEEVDFLKKRDLFRRAVGEIVELPARLEDQLFTFLYQNDGKLSNRRRTREFEALRDGEVEELEELYGSIFDGISEPS